MKSILDPSFRYTPSFDTDISKRFARVIKDQKAAQKVASPRYSQYDHKGNLVHQEPQRPRAEAQVVSLTPKARRSGET